MRNKAIRRGRKIRQSDSKIQIRYRISRPSPRKIPNFGETKRTA